MDLQETIKLLKKMRRFYINTYSLMTDEDIEDIAEYWKLQFSNYDYEVVDTALMKLVTTNKKPPTIAELKEVIDRDKGNNLDIYELSEILYKALANSTYQSKKEFYKLPDDIRKIVGSHERLKSMAKSKNKTELKEFEKYLIRQYKDLKKYEKYKYLG